MMQALRQLGMGVGSERGFNLPAFVVTERGFCTGVSG